MRLVVKLKLNPIVLNSFNSLPSLKSICDWSLSVATEGFEPTNGNIQLNSCNFWRSEIIFM